MTSANTMLVPLFLNVPLVNKGDDKPLVEFRLRMNSQLGFLENDKFDHRLMVYDENYQNSVAHSPTFIKHLQQVCDLLSRNFDSSVRILEVGCGKGDFLNLMGANGFTELSGFDTAYEGENKNIKQRYLTDDDKTNAQLVILRHTLEHILRPHEFLKKIKNINRGQGNIYIEVPCLDWIRKNNAFFDVAYEHVNYLTLNALTVMFGNKCLAKGQLFGGQYIYVIANLEDLAEEFASLYDNSDNWEHVHFNNLFPQFVKLFSEIESKIEPKRNVFLWGGAGKAGTFLHHCRILAPELMEKLMFAVDINPKKVGKYLPSSLVKIASKEEFFAQATVDDFLIIANPIYTNEIMAELSRNNLSEIEIFPL